MSSSISAPPIPTNVAVPLLKSEGQRDVAAERALTSDALTKLGAPQIGDNAWMQAREPGMTGVPVGMEVHRDASGASWTVIGASGANLDVARNVGGKIERTTAPFASFAEYTQQLMSSPATLDGRTGADLVQERVSANQAARAAGQPAPKPKPATPDPDMWVAAPGSEAAVAANGRSAQVTMADYTQAHALVKRIATVEPGSKEAEAVAKIKPDTFVTNWDDVLKIRHADTIKPVAIEPAAVEQAIALRRLVGDERIVTSSVGVHDNNDRERVIGTDSLPGDGKSVLDYAAQTVQWFHDKAGVDILPKGTPLIMHENNPAYLANASAGVQNGVVNINEGPKDESLRQKWLHEEPGKRGQLERKINDQIHERETTVLNHEWGHALRGQIWGEVFPQVQRAEDLSPEQAHAYLEHSMVNEAMSDLYGVAKGEHVDFGIRKVGTTQNQSADLDRYRALVMRTPMEQMDEHFGTQLVSKPALAVAKAHGFDALAAITGAADTDIGHQMTSHAIEVVSVPTAASALYRAAVQRFGATDPAVQTMRAEWQALKVPLEPTGLPAQSTGAALS